MDTATTQKDITKTPTAFLIASSAICLPNTFALLLFLITDIAVATKTRNVTVLIPPAVPTGEPPINISINETIADESVRFS